MLGAPVFQLRPAQVAHYENACAERIHAIIQQAYPGHPFEVTVSLLQFRTIIDHPLLPEGMAITVRLTDEDADGRIYVRLCGELLERFGIPRAGIEKAGGAFVVDYDQQADVLSDIK